MKEEIKMHNKLLRVFFFFIGILATLAYRIIIILNFYSPLFVQIAWYFGTGGFILYFGHRYFVQTRRAKLVEHYNLIEIVGKSREIKGKSKEALEYLVSTSLSSRARWNSLFIFILSIVALLAGIILDIFGF